MLLEKFKEGKEVDFAKAVQKYVASHFEKIKYSNVENFVNSILTTRRIAISLNTLDKSFESMKSYKDHIVTYISMINLLKSKFNFGNDNFSIKLEFGWYDIITNQVFTSFNIYHEYYSVLFNLAVMYYSIGKFENKGDETMMKEQIKYFQYAASLFEKIKREVPGVIPMKEIQPDLSINFLSYASYLCQANSQILIYEVSTKKGLAFELQAQLAKGVYEIFTLAYNLAKESLKKQISEEARIFINNRRFYYLACSFIKTKDSLGEIFKQKAEGYGKMISYLNLANDALLQGEKDLIKAKNYVNVDDYIEFRKQTETLIKDMIEKNSKIYYDLVPDFKLLPNIEKLIKANPLQPPDDFNKMIDGQNCLDDMIPREVKAMVDNYKQSIVEFINKSIENYENEGTITQFLSNLGLPTALEAIMSLNDLPSTLWKRILETHKKGGAMFLTNTFNTLDLKNEEISRKITELERLLFDEAQDDDKYRGLYSKRWIRKDSKHLNFSFFQQLHDFKQKLNQAKSCDTLIKESIMSNMKYFEFLNLTKEQLKSKMPVKNDTTGLKDSEEVKALSVELDIIIILKEKLMEHINKLFQTLNEENVNTHMVKVLQKKTTELAVLAENKVKYEAEIKNIEEINGFIAKSKQKIMDLNEKFAKLKYVSMKIFQENEKFCADLESYIQLFNQKCVALGHGLGFYSEFNNRLNQLNQKITDFILARDIEKNGLLQSLSGGSSIHTNIFNSSLLNPNTNIITNMDYQYNYQPSCKHYSQYPNNQTNQSFNSYTNFQGYK